MDDGVAWQTEFWNGQASNSPVGSAPPQSRNRIPVELEVPITWFGVPEDGDRHRWMFALLCSTLARRAVTVNMSTVIGGVHHAPRKAPDGGIVLSYHSVGDEPNVWRIKETPIAGWYSFDGSGFSGWSSLARFPERHITAIDAINPAAAVRKIDALREKFRGRNVSKYGQSSEAFDVSRPYVYFPMQVVDDPVASFCRLSPIDVLYRAAEIADRTGVLLVVKRHPRCKNTTVTGALNDITHKFRNILVSNASIHRHIEGCNSVIVANSGVGMEALLYGKPVFSFAASEYELATTPISRMEELESAFAPLPVDHTARAARFLTYYLDRCCFSIYEPASLDARIDEALSKVVPAGFQPPRDNRGELHKAYGHVEEMRKALTKSQVEFVHMQRVAKHAVDMAAQLAEERKQLERAPALSSDVQIKLEAATKTVGILHHAGLSASIAEVIVGSTARDAFKSYADLASKMRARPDIVAVVDAELLRSGYASGLDPAVAGRQVTAEGYQQLDDSSKPYQENNWLVGHIDIIRGARPRRVLEVGCGNGRFLRRIAEHVELAIGVDWARSSQLTDLPQNAMFQAANVLVDELPSADLCCTADVLEHFEPAKLPGLLRKLHQAAPVNYHVIACYDDGHSHCAVLHPGQWLALFKTIDPAYELVAVTTCPSRPDRMVCVITNLASAKDGIASLGDIAGTWQTNQGQRVSFLNDFSVHIGGQPVATWFPTGVDSAVMHWSGSQMTDILQLSEGRQILQINNLNGETHEVSRVS